MGQGIPTPPTPAKLYRASGLVQPGGRRDPEIDRFEQWQTDEEVFEVYEALKRDPLVRWKESYKMVLGLELSSTAGLDI